ncbi:hypothetical protein CAP39_10545 [Sphingomonas sp. IBVSS1]|nr:hypothetical protein CAP39_10545 [Sphingomonas sp. IBVSS1]
MGQEDADSATVPAAPLPDTPDAIEIAMAAAGSGQPVADISRTVLEKHAQLLDRQAKELALKHVGDLVQAGLWLLLAGGVLGLVGLAGWAAWQAAHSNALVVEPFSMPPALAAQGLTGEVAATRTLDEVKRMLDEGGSARTAASYENDWGDDLKIDIPNTGLTLDQGWKLLRRTLGTETRLSADIVQTQDRATMAVRISGGSAGRFAAPADAVDQLFVDAAEFVLRETQPYRYATYLGQFPARIDERKAVLQALAVNPSPVERSWATLGLANVERTLGNVDEAERWYRKAIAGAPDFLVPYNGLGSIQWGQGRWEEALATWRRSAAGNGSLATYGISITTLPCVGTGFVARLVRDRPGLLAARACTTRPAADEASRVREAGNLALIDLEIALMDHDGQAAMAAAQNAGDPSIRSQVKTVVQAMANALRQLEVANAIGDRAAIAAHLRDLERREQAAMADGELGLSTGSFIPTLNNPAKAEAELRLGHPDRAAALLAGAPATCLPCKSVRARLALATGDMAGAAAGFDAAVAMAPSLPHPLVDRGRFRLEQRQWAAAEADFRAAERLSRGWADPQKYLGDALAAQGKRAQAKAAWTEAVRRAPKWEEARTALAAA